jgi:hypothetical protein
VRVFQALYLIGNKLTKPSRLNESVELGERTIANRSFASAKLRICRDMFSYMNAHARRVAIQDVVVAGAAQSDRDLHFSD